MRASICKRIHGLATAANESVVFIRECARLPLFRKSGVMSGLSFEHKRRLERIFHRSHALKARRAIDVRHEASSWVYACFLSIRLFCNPALISS